MVTIHNSINRTMQMTENARKIARWQDEIINSMEYKSTIERINEMSKILINSTLSESLKEYQKQVNLIYQSMEPIQNTLEIISKQFKFTDISGLMGIDKINLNYQYIFKQFDFSNLVSNYYKMSNIDFNFLEYIEFEKEDEVFESELNDYEHLSEEEQQEVNNILGSALNSVSKGEIALEKIWNEWYANLIIKHPLTAKFIAKIAGMTFEKLITNILLVIITIGSTFGTLAIKEEPIASAPIITNVYVTNINIVQKENIKYYYKVIYVDEENNELIGYVSKRKYNEVIRNLNEISEE